jgi:hypothetical protein
MILQVLRLDNDAFGVAEEQPTAASLSLGRGRRRGSTQSEQEVVD